MRWVTGPWRWVTDDGFNHWAGPAGALACLDLRTIPEMSQQGGTPGMGLFLMPSGSRLGSDYTVLGDGNWHDVKLDQREKDALRIGKRVPDGPDLVGIIWDLLTSGSDPDGLTAPKPLMPGVDGRLQLIVGKRYAQRFAFGRHTHTAKVRDMLQRKFAANWDGASKMSEFDHARRCLDFDVKKYGLDDWREIVPTRLRGELPGPLPHATTITDDFNRANSSTIGGAFTEIEGNTDIVSNQAQQPTANEAHCSTSDLSSDDHYAQIIHVSGNDYGGPICRYTGTTTRTYYFCSVNPAGNSFELYKRLSGSFTLLDSSAQTRTAPDTYLVQSDGSSITGDFNGSNVTSATDTAISGNTKTGFRGHTVTHTFDDFEAADIAVGGITYTQLERDVRGMERGMYTGGVG